MKINQQTGVLVISRALANIITFEIDRSKVDVTQGAIINFRDSKYSAESGGYHPVEIAVRNNGGLAYITDFSYAGSPPYAELVKELDFDFELELFQQYDAQYPISEAVEMYELWQENFISYYEMGVYKVTVGALL